MVRKNKSLKGFADWVMQDEDIVVKLLITMSKWTGFILMSALLAIVIRYNENWLIWGLIGIFWIASTYNLIKFYKNGGTKTIEKTSANEMVWNKK